MSNRKLGIGRHFHNGGRFQGIVSLFLKPQNLTEFTVIYLPQNPSIGEFDNCQSIYLIAIKL